MSLKEIAQKLYDQCAEGKFEDAEKERIEALCEFVLNHWVEA